MRILTLGIETKIILIFRYYLKKKKDSEDENKKYTDLQKLKNYLNFLI